MRNTGCPTKMTVGKKFRMSSAIPILIYQRHKGVIL